jgi:hypothetical protein
MVSSQEPFFHDVSLHDASLHDVSLHDVFLHDVTLYEVSLHDDDDRLELMEPFTYTQSVMEGDPWEVGCAYPSSCIQKVRPT